MPQTDSLSLHRVWHMTGFLQASVQAEIVEHPAIRENPELENLATRAGFALGMLYLAIGKMHSGLAKPPSDPESAWTNLHPLSQGANDAAD